MHALLWMSLVVPLIAVFWFCGRHWPEEDPFDVLFDKEDQTHAGV